MVINLKEMSWSSRVILSSSDILDLLVVINGSSEVSVIRAVSFTSLPNVQVIDHQCTSTLNWVIDAATFHSNSSTSVYIGHLRAQTQQKAAHPCTRSAWMWKKLPSRDKCSLGMVGTRKLSSRTAFRGCSVVIVDTGQQHKQNWRLGHAKLFGLSNETSPMTRCSLLLSVAQLVSLRIKFPCSAVPWPSVSVCFD